MTETDSADESQQDENVQMNFLASQSQRERWEDYADEKGFRNLSGFFRFAIENHVKGEEGTAGGGGVSEELTEQLSGMVEGMNRIESRIHDLDNRMASIESQVHEDPDIKKLANEVFSVLPTREDIIDFEKGQTPPGTSPATAGTTEGIAAELDEEKYRIPQAIEKLQDDTNQVGTMTLSEEIQGWEEYREDGDETRYYKEA